MGETNEGKYCGSEEITVMTDVIVSMPFEMYRHLTKRNMQKKEFKIWGVEWETSDFICSKCGAGIKSGADRRM